MASCHQTMRIGKLMADSTLEITLTGRRLFTLRMKCGLWIIKLAVRIMGLRGVDVRFEDVGVEDDG